MFFGMDFSRIERQVMNRAMREGKGAVKVMYVHDEVVFEELPPAWREPPQPKIEQPPVPAPPLWQSFNRYWGKKR